MKACWYACKTLLGSTPDVNRRSVYYTDGKRHSDAIIEFNRDMKPWTAEDNESLNRLLEVLNGSQARPYLWDVRDER